jgi:predicted nuclease of restriction endonuclease-like (RecB) superfamily
MEVTMKGSTLDIAEYSRLIRAVRERIRSAQYSALKMVNNELISLYWDIGRMIVERQRGATWGKSVVVRLAADLQKYFPEIRGFSASNLWRMKVFYQLYSDNKKLAPMVREIGWTHNILILERCKDNLEREFYIRMTRKYGWSKNVLIHHVENRSYEKTLLGQTNFDETVPGKYQAQAKLAIRDEYVFDFLELGSEHNERELEKALIAKMEDFLREMGGIFAFLGSQYRLEIGESEYFIDLLLFHRHLKCLVAVDLKVTEFKPEHVGKMQFYLAALDDLVRLPDENPSIGIILCKTKNRTVVEYAIRNSRQPVGVAQYTILSKLPKNLVGQLPSPKQIEKLLGNLD